MKVRKFSEEELSNLLERGAESKALDYKKDIDWDDKKQRAELTRDILAFANTEGGYIVIGVSDAEAGFEPAGLSGDTLGKLDTTRINEFVNNYADPPINAVLFKVAFKGKHYAIVYVPPFAVIPHVLKRDYDNILRPGDLLVRTDDNNSARIQRAEDMHALINRCIAKRRAEILRGVSRTLEGRMPAERSADQPIYETEHLKSGRSWGEMNVPAEFSAFREAWFHPVDFIGELVRPRKLPGLLDECQTKYHGRRFPYEGRGADRYQITGGIEYKRAGPVGHGYEYWRFLSNGFFNCRESLWEDTDPRFEGTVGIASLLEFACATLLFLGKLMERTSNEDGFIYNFRLGGCKNRSLKVDLQGRGPLLPGEYVCREDEIHVTGRYSKQLLTDQFEDCLVSIVDECFRLFNWSGNEEQLRKDIAGYLAQGRIV